MRFSTPSPVEPPETQIEHRAAPRHVAPETAEKVAYALSVARDLERSRMYFNAAKAFREIVKRFPGTHEAEVAEERITALRPYLKNPD